MRQYNIRKKQKEGKKMKTLLTLITILTLAIGGLNGYMNTIEHAQQHNSTLYSAMNK